jgi:hypothetical protein
MRRALRAETERDQLRLKIPSKRERARQNKRDAQLVRLVADHESGEKAVAELEEQTQRLVVELAAARISRDEALAERDSA